MDTKEVKNGKPGIYDCIERCGNTFEITEEDLARCRENRWKPPLRCQPCRDKRRESAAGKVDSKSH